MKNIFLIGLILFSAFNIGYGQDQNPTPNNSSNDDVYYNDSENNYNDQNNNTQYNNQNQPTDDQNNAPTYQTFYDQLTPYGTWINTPEYGYVWMPNQVPGDFSPYLTGGHWVYTDYGWTWVSDYDWGWGPFHYGRWYDDGVYGWMWMPGYDWAPAWVVWGDYDGYYCWAPVAPNVIISSHYRPDNHHWNFVQHQHILHNNPAHYAVDSRTFASNHHFDVAQINTHVEVINHAGTYNQSVFFAGPKAAEVEKSTGQKINRVAVTSVSHAAPTRVKGDHIEIYRPNISRTNKQPAPAKVSRPEEVHPSGNRQQQQPVQQRNAEPRQAEPQRQQQPTWTPPRQSAPRQQQQAQPQPQRSQPLQRQQQPEHNFVPTERQQPMQQRQMQQPQRQAPSFSQPQHSAPAPAGGGMRGGGRH